MEPEAEVERKPFRSGQKRLDRRVFPEQAVIETDVVSSRLHAEGG
jgi:hypothetical protein